MIAERSVGHASRADMLVVLRGRPGIPAHVDRDLLQFAVIASGVAEFDEPQRKAVRKGFWNGIFATSRA